MRGRIAVWRRLPRILLTVFAVACLGLPWVFAGEEPGAPHRRKNAVAHPPDSPDEAQEYYRAKRAPVGETAIPVGAGDAGISP